MDREFFWHFAFMGFMFMVLWTLLVYSLDCEGS